MKILGIDIDWQTRWGTDSADLHVTVDQQPDWHNDFRYQKIQREKRSMSGKDVYAYYYWAEADGLLQAHYHTPWNEEGYAGSEFVLQMMDGTIETIKGPWDEGASTANKLLEGKYFSIGLNSPQKTYYVATMMRVDMINEYLYKYSGLMQLKPRVTQTTGLSDEQSAVILHGQSIKPDTVRYILDKKLMHSFPHTTIQSDEHTIISEPVKWN